MNKKESGNQKKNNLYTKIEPTNKIDKFAVVVMKEKKLLATFQKRKREEFENYIFPFECKLQ